MPWGFGTGERTGAELSIPAAMELAGCKVQRQ